LINRQKEGHLKHCHLHPPWDFFLWLQHNALVSRSCYLEFCCIKCLKVKQNVIAKGALIVDMLAGLDRYPTGGEIREDRFGYNHGNIYSSHNVRSNTAGCPLYTSYSEKSYGTVNKSQECNGITRNGSTCHLLFVHHCKSFGF
jgi:hypothetical protein